MGLIRQFSQEDYSLYLIPWFVGHEWAPIPKEALPKTGYFLCKNSVPIAYSCYYGSECSFAVIGYTIVNPYTKVTDLELELLLSHVIDETKKAGYTYLHYSTGSGGIGIVRKLKKLGMSVTCSKGYILGMSTNNENIDFLKED